MSSTPPAASHSSFLGLRTPFLRHDTHLVRRANITTAGVKAKDLPIIAICHLNWDWVWQRPQQFLSRLAKTHPLLFVQTHCSDVPESMVKIRRAEGLNDINILEMHLPAKHWHDETFIDLERRRVLKQVLQRSAFQRFQNAILWINDPMAVTAFAGHLGEKMIVYDCMDELTQFAMAPPGLVERERELTQLADLIFCGGRKMREKRLPLNANTHFYGTGVDCQHFGTAMQSSLAVHPAIASLPKPVLGYFGVIDERIDYPLIAKLADANPKWSIAMIGPVAKVDPAMLPQRPNIHWLGGRPYDELPALTKGMDVCLMPFAINAATEFINPTKALEYMAAGKPVVATALCEVKSNFKSASHIAEGHEEFIAMCMSESTSPSKHRIRNGLHLAADNTWESIVSKMEGHMQDVLNHQPFVQREPATQSSSPALATTPPIYV